jgi:hypothetical protein
MKKLIEKIGIETAFAGLFGVIAIVAVFLKWQFQSLIQVQLQAV